MQAAGVDNYDSINEKEWNKYMAIALKENDSKSEAEVHY